MLRGAEGGTHTPPRPRWCSPCPSPLPRLASARRCMHGAMHVRVWHAWRKMTSPFLYVTVVRERTASAISMSPRSFRASQFARRFVSRLGGQETVTSATLRGGKLERPRP